jgi:hypothetical protein
VKLLFLDDAVQRTCRRPRIGRLVALGGVVVDAEAARALDGDIEKLCRSEYGFPEREPFKWSPGRDHWMRDNLVDARRQQFFKDVLSLAAKRGAVGQVTISDSTMKQANPGASSHEMDVFTMSLERFNYLLGRQSLGLVIAARPSGGRSDEDKFLAQCADIVSVGTSYAKFGQFATNVLTMPFVRSRLLQVADLVTSITTAMVAGHTEFAGPVFSEVKSLLRSSLGRIGGVGVKIHPDYAYANLYHWVLGDTTFWRAGVGVQLPLKDRPYSRDGMTR